MFILQEKFQLEEDLKAATSNQERERMQRKLNVVDGNLQDNKSWVHYWEERANKNGEELKQLESTIKNG